MFGVADVFCRVPEFRWVESGLGECGGGVEMLASQIEGKQSQRHSGARATKLAVVWRAGIWNMRGPWRLVG